MRNNMKNEGRYKESLKSV